MGNTELQSVAAQQEKATLTEECQHASSMSKSLAFGTVGHCPCAWRSWVRTAAEPSLMPGPPMGTWRYAVV